MKELNIVQKILFSIHSIIYMIILVIGIYLLFGFLFLLTGQYYWLSLMPVWFGIDFYKNQTLKTLGYKPELPIYKLEKSDDESNKVEE